MWRNIFPVWWQMIGFYSSLASFSYLCNPAYGSWIWSYLMYCSRILKLFMYIVYVIAIFFEIFWCKSTHVMNFFFWASQRFCTDEFFNTWTVYLDIGISRGWIWVLIFSSNDLNKVCNEQYIYFPINEI